MELEARETWNPSLGEPSGGRWGCSEINEDGGGGILNLSRGGAHGVGAWSKQGGDWNTSLGEQGGRGWGCPEINKDGGDPEPEQSGGHMEEAPMPQERPGWSKQKGNRNLSQGGK